MADRGSMVAGSEPAMLDLVRQAQLDFLRQDHRFGESTAVASAMTLSERLREVEDLCAHAAALLESLPPDVKARAVAYREALPADSEPVLRRLAGLDPPGPPWT
jgi:hypothetical protein